MRRSPVRSVLFAVAYYTLSIFYALAARLRRAGAGPRTGRRRCCASTRAACLGEHWIAGIKIDVKGKARLPAGAFIVAAKHHSWGDGFVMFAHVDNLAFVAGDHLERIPLLKGVLRQVRRDPGRQLRRTRSAPRAGREGRRGERRRPAHPDLPGGPPRQGRRAFPLPHRRLLHVPRLQPAGGPGRHQPRPLLAAAGLHQERRPRHGGVSRPDPDRPRPRRVPGSGWRAPSRPARRS